jgi:hypothetical protein
MKINVYRRDDTEKVLVTKLHNRMMMIAIPNDMPGYISKVALVQHPVCGYTADLIRLIGQECKNED